MLERNLGSGLKDTYISDVKVLLHFDGNVNNQMGAAASIAGTASYVSGKFGQGVSITSNGYIQMPGSIMAHNGLMASASPWTIEFLMMPYAFMTTTSIAPGFGESQNSAGGSNWTFGMGTNGILCFSAWNGSTTVASTGTDNGVLNDFNHLALCSDGTTLYGYLNGKLQWSRARAVYTWQNYAPALGYWNNYSPNCVYDEFRYTAGIRRYIDDFTPSLYPFPNV